MEYKFSASMMCADFSNLEREVKSLERAGMDSFHIDIMDGRFVPNFGMGLQDLDYIRKTAGIPVECHLMIERPDHYLRLFTKPGVHVIYIHPESEYHPSTTIQHIREAGITPGIAVNPGTSVESILELLYIVDRVLVMSVNPGHAGQVYLPYVGRKIDQLIALKKECNFELYWDGACSTDKIAQYGPRGVDGFVLGTNALFGHKEGYGEIIPELRKLGI